MNTQPATPDPTPKALEELRTVLGQLRDNKGKPQKGITSTVKEHWSRLVETVFTNRDCPVDTLFKELFSLPPGVVAGGIANAWENMDEARRASYLDWLKSLDSEKAASQKVVLIPSLLERFPSVSLELLCGLVLNQELKNRLATAILGNTPENVGLMITPEMPEWKARQTLERLCQISEGPKVDMMAKWAVLRLTLKTIVERKMQKDALSQGLIQHVAGQLPNLASQLQERLQDLLKDLDPALLGRFFPSAAETASAGATQQTSPRQDEAMAQSGATDTPLVSPGTGTGTSSDSSLRSNVLDRVASWLDTLHGQATLLMDTRARILQLEQENQTVKAQLDAARVAEEAAHASAEEATAAQQQARHRLQVLEEKSREAQKALNSSLANIRDLESELHKVRERESEWGTKLRQRETEFLKEREDLQRLIQGNADRRLQEFRNSVGGSLRKLLNRVPDRGAPVPSELGAVLLARLHEVIDELESKGIRARPEREAVSK
jgi:hypothetical protein